MLKKFLILVVSMFFLIGCYGQIDVMGNLIWIRNEDLKKEVYEKNKDFLGRITKRQKVEDYEYMWKTLRESYPFFGVAKRLGIDVDGIYRYYKRKIKNSNGDGEFVYLINECLDNFYMIGHLESVDYDNYENARYLYKDNPKRRAWYNAINNIKAVYFYDKYKIIEKEIINLENKESRYEDETENIVTKIIAQDKIAYIKIAAFDYISMEQDGRKILEFYNKIKDYKNLIIDVTDNGGGSDYCWMYYIVSPNIARPMLSEYYILFNESKNNKPYLNDADITLISKKIEHLPYFPNLNKEDIKNLKNFYHMSLNVFPNNNENMFKGKIWSLINDKTYSSADKYANFCKATGFSTLVGTVTGGDGIGVDPEYLMLPNSGMLIRYSMEYGINPDGSNNEEFGTIPDFNCEKGETPLDACLKLILSR